jgi:predicted membrane metal-binding protein
VTVVAFDLLGHVLNFSLGQVTQSGNLVFLAVAFLAFLFAGIAFRYLIGAAIALLILVILLTVAAGFQANFNSVSTFFVALWAFLQPLVVALEVLLFTSGVYSLLVSLAGFALGYFFPRTPGV